MFAPTAMMGVYCVSKTAHVTTGFIGSVLYMLSTTLAHFLKMGPKWRKIRLGRIYKWPFFLYNERKL